MTRQKLAEPPVRVDQRPLPVFEHWIDGRSAGSANQEFGDVFDPAVGAVIARVARGGAADVDAAARAARAAFPVWSDASLAARTEVLFAFRGLVHRHREELAALVVRDHGKTFNDALGGVLRGIEAVDFACGVSTHTLGGFAAGVSTNVDSFTLMQPLGVVACITPFNFPVMVPMWMYPLALACGNAVILKPSSHTPHATLLQASLLAEAGLPPGLFNIVYGGREAVDALISHPDVDAVSFVGSTAVGRHVYRTATEAGKRAGCYTSAKNHMIVLPDADMELAADSAVNAAYGSAGERCMAITVLVTVGDAGDRIVPKIVERVRGLRIGAGRDAEVDMGPMYSSAHRQSVIEWIDRGVAEGAELIVDGRSFVQPDHPGGFFLGVSLFDRVLPTMSIYREEIFGPVLSVVRVATYEEALALANGHRYANGTALFTNDGGAARRFQIEVKVPMVGINVPIPVPVGFFSFGGARDSAFGDMNMRGMDGVRFYTQVKEVTVRWPDPSLRGVNLGFPQNH